jgi:hypothetical protein
MGFVSDTVFDMLLIVLPAHVVLSSLSVLKDGLAGEATEGRHTDVLCQFPSQKIMREIK